MVQTNNVRLFCCSKLTQRQFGSTGHCLCWASTCFGLGSHLTSETHQENSFFVFFILLFHRALDLVYFKQSCHGFVSQALTFQNTSYFYRLLSVLLDDLADVCQVVKMFPLESD